MLSSQRGLSTYPVPLPPPSVISPNLCPSLQLHNLNLLIYYWLPCSPTTLISMRAENISVLFPIVTLMLRTLPGPFTQLMFVEWMKWDNGYNVFSIVLANGKYSIHVNLLLKFLFLFYVMTSMLHPVMVVEGGLIIISILGWNHFQSFQWLVDWFSC